MYNVVLPVVRCRCSPVKTVHADRHVDRRGGALDGHAAPEPT